MALNLKRICRRCEQMFTPTLDHIVIATRRASFTRTVMRKATINEEKPVNTYVGVHHRRRNRIYLWGNTRTGALGISKFLDPQRADKKPVLAQSKPYNFHWAVRASFDVKHVAAGYGFTVYAGKSRDHPLKLVGCGINTDSQLGFHSQEGSPVDYVISPQFIELPVAHLDDAVFAGVACGRAHTVVATNKAVYTMGNNAFGQCGRAVIEGENYSGSRTVHTIERSDVVKVVCGHDHSLILTDDGSVYSCGLGTDGQTGLGNFECTHSFTKVKGDIEGVKVTDIDCRCDTVLAVSDEGELFGWGNSEYGQFDMVTREPQISQPTHLPVSSVCGKVTSAASAGTKCALVNEKGEVYVWGYGILGKGPKLQQSDEPQQIPMTLFGMTTFSQDIKVDKVFSGVNYLAALTNTKVLYTWGKNTDGCLGLGHRNDQYFPFMVSIGSDVDSIACGVDHMITMCRAFV